MTGAPDLRVDAQLGVETDGSFAALLCALPLLYGAGALPAAVSTVGEPRTGALFGHTLEVATDAGVASRVEARIEQLAPGLVSRLLRAFLSEQDGIETDVLRLVVRVAARDASVADDWRFGPAHRAQRVSRERHRMEAFVRFERHTDAHGVEHFVAHVRPEYHVLPILGAHFADRYGPMRWAVVDVRRRLALVHDAPATERAPDVPPTRLVPAHALGEMDETPDESTFQAMWQTYFRAVDIPERRNLALHQRHVPRRYWPYLTEKWAPAAVETPASTP